MGRFAIDVTPFPELVVVKPAGELDLAGVPRLDEEVRELIGLRFDHVAIDLRELSFIGVAGVRVLLSLSAAARDSRWRLSVIRGPAVVDRVFALTATRARLPFTSAFSLARQSTDREP